MKKNAAIAIIVLIVILVGGYAVFHKSDKPASTKQASNSQTTAPSVQNSILTTKTDPSLGKYLATTDGLPLYTYSGDSSGKSTVTGALLASWPAYQDTGSKTNLPAGVGTITRTDNGQVQYTYNGLPLYTFVTDSAGKVTGDGVSGFNLAKPAAAPATTTPTNNSTAPSSSDNSSSSSPYNY